MSGRHGPDFADQLTTQEQRTLDALLARVAESPERPARSPWVAPLAAAAVAASLLLGASAISLGLGRGPSVQTPPLGAAAQPASATLLDGLAVAADRMPDPPPGDVTLYRRELRFVVTARADGCRVTAIETQVWTAAGAPARWSGGNALTATLRMTTIAPAAEALRRGGCSGGVGATTPRTLFDGATDDLAKQWTALAEAPEYLSPRWVSETLTVREPWLGLPADADGIDERLRKLCVNQPLTNCAALRWTVLVELLASAETSQAHRSAAARLGARAADATPLPGETSDVTGRPGVAVRVPYLPMVSGTFAESSAPTTADLTFDERTGALLQREIRTVSGKLDVTVYLTATRVAAAPR
jgi:hypothetical protein